MASATKAPVAAALLILAGCWSQPQRSQGQMSAVTNDGGVCQHTCTPDPGSPLVDCAAAEANYELGPLIWDFEGANATSMYSYTDNSAGIASFVQLNLQYGTWDRKTWEPPTFQMQRCSNPVNPSNGVIHIQGGPFLSWGGGVGISMRYYPGRPNPGATVTRPSDIYYDVSEWEGVSFWARRGPDSQAGMRVLVGDKNTDDDISYIMYREDPTQPRNCERVRECACLNHQACIQWDVTLNQSLPDPVVSVVRDGQPVDKTEFNELCILPHSPNTHGTNTWFFCGDADPLASGSISASGFVQCDSCEHSHCDEPYPAYPDDYPAPQGVQPPAGMLPQGTDRQFVGKACRQASYLNGVTSSFCLADGERLPEPSEQCGDHWTTPVTLSNDWQFFTVPFNSMGQQGWAKRFPALDVTAASVIRFTWDGGWIDYYIDDVRFYRHRK